MNYNRDEMIKSLRSSYCSIDFTKVDGSTRHMLATLKGDKIPGYKEDYKVTSVQNLTILKVFDAENEGWRSFKVDSVTKFEVLLD